MENSHTSCENHDYSGHIKYRAIWIFSLIFVPVTLFLMRSFITRQILYRASAYETSGMHQESIRQYKKALFIDRHNAEGWNGLADVYKIIGSIEDAARLYRKALETEPGNRRALYSLGMLLALHKRDYEQAASCWNKVREQGPGSADERDKYPLSYHRLSLLSLETYYRRMNDADGEARIKQELHTYYPGESKMEQQIPGE